MIPVAELARRLCQGEHFRMRVPCGNHLSMAGAVLYLTTDQGSRARAVVNEAAGENARDPLTDQQVSERLRRLAETA